MNAEGVAARMRALLLDATWDAGEDLAAAVARWERMCGGVLDLMVVGNEVVILDDAVLGAVYAFAAGTNKCVHRGHPARRHLDPATFLQDAGRRLPRCDEERLRLLAALDQAYPPGAGAGPA
jgi:hypothetical protein